MRNKIFMIVSFLMVLACSSVQTPKQESVQAVSVEASLQKKSMLWGTHYYSHAANSQSTGYPLYEKNGKAISPKISQADYCACGIEGTCSIDGQVYDFAGTRSYAFVPFECKYSGHKIHWAKGKFKYGKGNKGNALEPFVSVAADQSIYPFGTVIYIPAAKGLVLPGGKIHDGYFKVADVGSAIKGNHLDFFTGPFYKQFKFPFVKSSASKTFEAYIQ